MKEIKKYFTSSVLVQFATSIFLFLAILKMPIGYYKLLRWVVCLTGLYIAFISYSKNKKMNFGVWLFCIIALVFNPFIPFYFSKSDWQIIDIMTGIIFIASVFIMREKEE